MAQDIYYHSKTLGKGHRQEIVDQGKTNTQQNKLKYPCLVTKCSSDLQIFLALLAAIQLFILDWFHIQLAALLDRYLILEGILGFTFRASHNGPIVPTFMAIPSTHLASETFLSWVGFHISFHKMAYLSLHARASLIHS